MRRLLLLTFAVSLSADVLINCGSTITTDSYAADQFFTGGQIWGPGVVGYVDLGPGPWQTLRFNPSFSYDVPLINGLYTVNLLLIEPNKTGPNQRRFTIAANNQSTPPIDLFAVAGLRKQYTTTLLALVGNGVLHIDFRATLGNAVVSAIEIRPYMPDVFIPQIRLPPSPTADPDARAAIVIDPQTGKQTLFEANLDGGTVVVTDLESGKVLVRIWLNGPLSPQAFVLPIYKARTTQ